MTLAQLILLGGRRPDPAAAVASAAVRCAILLVMCGAKYCASRTLLRDAWFRFLLLLLDTQCIAFPLRVSFLLCLLADGWMDGLMDGGMMDGYMDRWMEDGWLDG